MTVKDDKDRYEKNFREIYNALNRRVTYKVLISVFTLFVAFCTVIMGLGYKDLQESKTLSNRRHIELIEKINDVRLMIAGKNNINIPQEKTKVAQNDRKN